jgi:hypothetical protein
MKAYLMYRDADFDLESELPPNEADLMQDLELETLLDAMARGDEFLWEVGKRGLLLSLDDPSAVAFRQGVLRDCLNQAPLVREMYELAIEALQSERKLWMWVLRDSPDSILSRSVQALEAYVEMLKRLRSAADEHASAFRSAGFTRFFAMVRDELTDGYFAEIDDHLTELKFRRGMLISAVLGAGNKGTEYELHRAPEFSWLERIAPSRRGGYAFQIPDRDENGFKMLSQIRGQGINIAANALAQSVDHIRSFFAMVRTELGFYVGCINLHETLSAKGEPLCFPEPVDAGERALAGDGLYDPCLSLKIEQRVIGNRITADDKRLVMITGANHGGKSTFLRALGVAQLMTQAGMFAPGEGLRANVVGAMFTHFKREEDASMTSGKLDEELQRMSWIGERIRPGDLLLGNESFASTNEREGSQIARQVLRALTDAGVKVCFVTHLFDLAHGMYAEAAESSLFLRAQRGQNGERTFKLEQGEPLPTAFGADSYRRVFGDAAPTAADSGSAWRRSGGAS